MISFGSIVSRLHRYESQAIVEWLEEVPWPAHALVNPSGPPPRPLYPADRGLRVDVKLWQ